MRLYLYFKLYDVNILVPFHVLNFRFMIDSIIIIRLIFYHTTAEMNWLYDSEQDFLSCSLLNCEIILSCYNTLVHDCGERAIDPVHEKCAGMRISGLENEILRESIHPGVQSPKEGKSDVDSTGSEGAMTRLAEDEAAGARSPLVDGRAAGREIRRR